MLANITFFCSFLLSLTCSVVCLLLVYVFLPAFPFLSLFFPTFFALMIRKYQCQFKKWRRLFCYWNNKVFLQLILQSYYSLILSSSAAFPTFIANSFECHHLVYIICKYTKTATVQQKNVSAAGHKDVEVRIKRHKQAENNYWRIPIHHNQHN